MSTEPTAEYASSPRVPECQAFVWVGQPWSSCDRCGRPASQHAYLECLKDDAGPFGDDDDWIMVPWADKGLDNSVLR